ncbi:MAG: MBL fold metallo-hydrolase [Acidobacteria bacterium]|nr:MBL fold metallo-hydrolase [Acidobacteriota bacterium]
MNISLPRPVVWVVLSVLTASTVGVPTLAQDAPRWTASLGDIRRTAALIPGPRPLRVNFLKFAESHRTKNFSVDGAPTAPSIQARTAFQLVYPDGHVMVDAGMDITVHDFFGRGVQEPYLSEAARQVEQAVRDARLVVVTHEHGDHVAGVVHAPDAADLARKTVLTRAQAQTLLTAPQMPEIALTPEAAGRFITIDYDRYFPLAPGVVLIKAAGHTPGSQIVFVALASGREYLLIGDVAWHMDGVRQVKGKAAPWVTEDARAVMDQLTWLNELSRTEPDLVIVASHDEEQHIELTRQQLLSSQLE